MRLSPFAPLERLLAPAPQAQRVSFLTTQPFAHRGLHGGPIIENSRAAFEAAIKAGHGIECDVQASWDGEAFVFHDEELDRLTGETGAFGGRSANILDLITLKGTTETVPRLSEILRIVLGRVPILIEVKAKDRRIAPLCLAVRRALEGYRGEVAVMSFNPEVGRWFAQHAARLTRGLVVTEEGHGGMRGRIERHTSLLRARPDFLAYDVRDLPSRFAARQRARGLPVLTWTVRDMLTQRTANAHADEMIYEKIAV